MSSKKRQHRSRRVSKTSRRGRGGPSSLLIPIVVGVIVVAVIAFAIWSLERQQPAAAAVLPGDISVPVVTAEPKQTGAIPYPDVPRISVTETKAKLDEGAVILVDVRGLTEYSSSHAAGAISIPSTEIDSRLGELPKDHEIVVYCT